MVRHTPISVHETSSNLETDQLGEPIVLPLRVPVRLPDPLYGHLLASALQPHTALLAIAMFGGCLDGFPDVGQRLVDGACKLLASGHVVASVDKGHVAYPNEPENVRRCGSRWLRDHIGPVGASPAAPDDTRTNIRLPWTSGL